MDADAIPNGPMPRRRRAPQPARVLAIAAGLMVVVCFAALAAGGSLAYLNASTPAGHAGSVTAASASLGVSQDSGAPGATVAVASEGFQAMLPGDVAGRQVTLHNTGAVPLDVTASLAASVVWQIRTTVGQCPAAAGTGAALGTSPSALVAGLAPGATAQVCVQVALPMDAPAASEGTSASFTVLLDAVQVAP